MDRNPECGAEPGVLQKPGHENGDVMTDCEVVLSKLDVNNAPVADIVPEEICADTSGPIDQETDIKHVEPAVHKRYLEWKGFEEVEYIGRGTFGILFKVFDGQFYAVKCVGMTSCGAEAKLLMEIDHENIIKCHGAWTENPEEEREKNFTPAELGINVINAADTEDDEPVDDASQRTIQNNDLSDEANSSLSEPAHYQEPQEPGSCQGKPEHRYQYIKLELCDGDLADLLYGKMKCDPIPFEAMFTNIVKGVAYLQSKNIVHRDLKPENILIKKQLENGAAEIVPKIADFGTSACLEDPELFQLQQTVDSSALGKLAVAMLWRTTSDDQATNICKEIIEWPKCRKYEKNLHFELIRELLIDDQKNCIKAEEVLRRLSEHDSDNVPGGILQL